MEGLLIVLGEMKRRIFTASHKKYAEWNIK